MSNVNYSGTERKRDELFSTTQVAQLAGVSRQCVIKWARQGRVSSIRAGNAHGVGIRLFSKVEIESFLRERHKAKRKRAKRRTGEKG